MDLVLSAHSDTADHPILVPKVSGLGVPCFYVAQDFFLLTVHSVMIFTLFLVYDAGNCPDFQFSQILQQRLIYI